MSALPPRLRSLLAALPSWRSLAACVAVAGAMALVSTVALGLACVGWTLLVPRLLAWLAWAWPTCPAVFAVIGVISLGIALALPLALAASAASAGLGLIFMAMDHLDGRARGIR